jgi:hypothetical protein
MKRLWITDTTINLDRMKHIAVSRPTYAFTGDYVAIVQDPTNRNEVRITSLRGNWCNESTNMAAGRKAN